MDDSMYLAAEECPPRQFSLIHRFSKHDEKIIRALMSHGPVLLRGPRGSGKSALMLEAKKRLIDLKQVICIYVNLKYLPMLQSTGKEYWKHFAVITSKSATEVFHKKHDYILMECQNIESLKSELEKASAALNQRIVILFDDPAHLGRETSLDEFFDAFRILSSSQVSCKAAIYPGVTRFGTRFDAYNDSIVLDVSRDERNEGYAEQFAAILSARHPKLAADIEKTKSANLEQVAGFLGRAVLANMRAFVRATNDLAEQESYDGAFLAFV
jgi:hypothetical protein